jgi:hypothetical protein
MGSIAQLALRRSATQKRTGKLSRNPRLLAALSLSKSLRRHRDRMLQQAHHQGAKAGPPFSNTRQRIAALPGRDHRSRLTRTQSINPLDSQLR